MRMRVIEFELTSKSDEPIDLTGYSGAYVLLRYQGRPVGALMRQDTGSALHPREIHSAVGDEYALHYQVLRTGLQEWLLPHTAEPAAKLPSWSVIVCTRDRTEDLRRCLDSLLKISAPGGEIVIVDNAPSNSATAELVARYPVRYVREDRPGLNWARTTGARAATGEIVIYTDDDVVVEPGWISAILEPFGDPRVAAATGITLPLELETDAQILFERYGGFGRGFARRVFERSYTPPAGAGVVGAGANMAFRRSIVNGLRLFEAELDCGTVARTGGDNYAFYKILAAEYKIVYTPEALVWHRHRREYDSLRRTLRDYSVGGFAFLTRCFVEHRDWQALVVAWQWFRTDHLRQLKRALLRKENALPLDLIWPQITGCAVGPWAYRKSRAQERAYGPLPAAPELEQVS